MIPDLTLESAVIEVRQIEAVMKQQSVVWGEVLRGSTIEAVKTRNRVAGSLESKSQATSLQGQPLDRRVVQGVDSHRLTVDHNVTPKKQHATNVTRKVTIKAVVKPESALTL